MDSTTSASVVPARKPKRPLTAYNIFFKDRRKEILERGSSGGFAALARNIAAMWKSASNETKTYYTHRAADDKERYKREMAEWQERAVGASLGDDKDEKLPSSSKGGKKRSMSPRHKGESPVKIARVPSGAGGDSDASIESWDKSQGLLPHSTASLASHDQTRFGGGNMRNQATWAGSGNSSFPSQMLPAAQPTAREAHRNASIARGFRQEQLLSISSQHETSLEFMLQQQQQLRQRERQQQLQQIQQRRHLLVGGERSRWHNPNNDRMESRRELQAQPPLAAPSSLAAMRPEPPSFARTQSRDQSTFFTPNSLRRVFESDIHVDEIPSAAPDGGKEEEEEEESTVLNFDAETRDLMARMLEQEEDDSTESET